MEDVLRMARDIGFDHRGVLDPATLELRTEVREMCSADRCQNYGKSWTCPPACSSLEEGAAEISKYNSGILVQTTAFTEDDFDYETMQQAGELQQERIAKMLVLLRKSFPQLLALGSGGCRLCAECTYPNAPCRNPELAVPSMEAYGLWVSDVCKRNELPYNYGPGSITYTACFLFNLKNEITEE